MSRKKLGIIVPYRDRPGQLRSFIKGIGDYFATTVKNFRPYIFVVEQKDTKDFNRGKLLNVGFLKAEEFGCDYVVFHDIDMLPYNVDYSFSETPLQLANKFDATEQFTRTINDDYFGGVTLFSVDAFRKINGYSNKYRGWGFEDNDLLYRCEKNGIKLDEQVYRSYSENGKTISFNGKNSHIKIPNNYTYARPLTFYASFYPSDIKCDKDEITDEYAVFAVPGEDLNLSYNSFRTYKFEAFLSSNEAVSVTSKTLPNMPCRAVVTVDSRNKEIYFYLNGIKIGKNRWEKYGIKKYNTEPYFYLGVGNPKRKLKQKWFKGNIDEFATFNRILTEEEIRDISTKISGKLTDNIRRYKPDDSLIGYYRADATQEVKVETSKSNIGGRYNELDTELQLVDLSGKNNHGSIHNCKIIENKHQASTKIKIPHRRRGKYKLIPHEEQGYTLGYWKNWKSRINQLRYYEIINSGKEEYLEDGLSSCRYKVLNEYDHFLGANYKIDTKVISIRS
jgi:hypothetical protein